jgi:hypothetical protein
MGRKFLGPYASVKSLMYHFLTGPALFRWGKAIFSLQKHQHNALAWVT